MTITRKGPGVRNVAATVGSLDNVEARVGWFESATYEGGQTVAYVATIQEFGAPSAGISARPFMRPAVEDNGPEWMELLAQGAQAAMTSGMSGETVLEMVAARAAGDVAKKIAAVTSPPLHPATIAKRKNKSTKPLVDTGKMIQSVTHRVGPL